jgi:hypothetical protein
MKRQTQIGRLSSGFKKGAARNRHRRFLFSPLGRVLSVFICVHLWLLPSSGRAQEEAAQEIAVNLAEGRVVICAAKDGIVLATTESHGEAGSRPPAVAMLSALRAGVILGAVEWVQPESKDKPVRLDSELPRLVGTALNTSARPTYSNSASDLEAVGVSLLERVRQLAEQLHNKINLREDEPLIRLVIVGYVPDYGPEAWTIDYRIRQDDLGNDYFRTRVLRPSYNQLYPPEKGQPHTLVEVRYPPENRAKDEPELLDLLRQNDVRLAGSRAGNDALAKSVGFVLGGQSEKSIYANDVTFLKAGLKAVTDPGAKLSMAVVDFDRGFQWVVAPQEAPPPPPKDNSPREPDAPTLRHKSQN